ncbi:P-loop NTPase, partial [Halorubrum sp. AD140]|uniref:nucleotide-binding protein n=1 Tax=Halorubrum sp. AD140 TaxID=3050073 RepID=UPI002ACCF472
MIAVAGGKGGSGKTTTTLGLARALSRRGAPVVAADADWDLPNLARLAAETSPE